MQATIVERVFFAQMTGGKMVHIPYKSSAESVRALISGQGADIIFEKLAPGAGPQSRRASCAPWPGA